MQIIPSRQNPTLKIDDLVHHYTDASALLSIVQTRTLWSTVSTHLNDRSEGTLITQRAGVLLRQHFKSLGLYTPHCIDVAEAVLRQGRVPSLVSFSRVRDSLPMFRMYCPPCGGYSIGFLPNFLNEAGQYAEVIYDEAKLEADARRSLERLLISLSAWEGLRQSGRSADNIAADFHNASQANAAIVTERVFLDLMHKQSTFSVEQEGRLISFGGEICYRSSADRSFILPYRRIELQNIETDVLLLAGPNIHPEFVIPSISAFIDAAKLAGTKWRFWQGGDANHPFRLI